MAEHVQAALDDMVAPLKDLMDRGIFSDSEIKAIVTRRRESEYLLRRRAARKSDFLRYIEAETALEKLRQLRTKKILQRQARKSEATTPRKAGKLPIGDIHIIQLIHLLFTRALRKFRSDLSIHLQHAAFAKEAKSYNKLSTIYTEALQVHPRNIGLWIEAASHEFFGYKDESGKLHGGGSIQAARVLMKRGLRLNPTSQDLWVQYFSLEMHISQKLRGRREILQITAADEKADSLYAVAPIPTIVFKSAIQAIPDDFSFRMMFLDVCRIFPQTEKIEETIVESLEHDFADSPDAWIARAKYVAAKDDEGTESSNSTGFVVEGQYGDTGDKDDEKRPKKHQRTDAIVSNKVLSILTESIEAIPSGEMFVRVVQFAREYREHSLSAIVEIDDFVEKAFAQAWEKESTVTVDLVLEQSDYLVGQNNLDGAIQCLKDYATLHPVDVHVSLQLAQLLVLKNEQIEAKRELQKLLALTPLHDAMYMKILLELFGLILKSNEQSELKNVFEKIILLAPNKNPTFQATFGIGTVAHACLAFLKHCPESERRNTVEWIIERSSYCESARGKSEEELRTIELLFHEAIAALDLSSKSKNEGKDSLKVFVRRLYDRAIMFFVHCAPDISHEFRARRDDSRFS